MLHRIKQYLETHKSSLEVASKLDHADFTAFLSNPVFVYLLTTFINDVHEKAIESLYLPEGGALDICRQSIGDRAKGIDAFMDHVFATIERRKRHE